MIVYIVAAAQALVYLGAVPLHLAFCLRTRDGLRFGAGISAFVRRAARRRAQRAARRGELKLPKLKKGASPPGWLMPCLRCLRLESVRVQGSLGMGEAAATALACGGVRALGRALRGVAPRVRLEVAPDFSEDGPRVDLRGMIRVRSGQIILAALRGGTQYANGRIAQWKNTRLKA